MPSLADRQVPQRLVVSGRCRHPPNRPTGHHLPDERKIALQTVLKILRPGCLQASRMEKEALAHLPALPSPKPEPASPLGLHRQASPSAPAPGPAWEHAPRVSDGAPRITRHRDISEVRQNWTDLELSGVRHGFAGELCLLGQRFSIDAGYLQTPAPDAVQ